MNHSSINITGLQRDVALSRDQRAYRELFTHYYQPLIRFSTSIVRSREAAEEIYSSVFLKLWDLGSALNNIENLTVFLFVTIKNASLNYLAKYHKVKTIDIDSIEACLPEQHETPEVNLLHTELQLTIKQAIVCLPPKCQLVYKLIKEEGFSYKQVAVILAISVNTVEGHMTTALGKLAQFLQPYLHPGRN